MSARLPAPLVIALTLAACGPPGDADGGTDAGNLPDAQLEPCARAADCDDNLFCTVDDCRPSHPAADARGCISIEGPCAPGETCDEATDECSSECTGEPDADGDGHDSLACGGDDCDDTDGDRHPGNTEVCDALGHDEDCSEATLGGPTDADVDGDGAVSDQCCNGATCGDDCNDGADGVRPGASEICNGVDDNCNGDTDEGVLGTVYRDMDDDGFGDPNQPMPACFDDIPNGYVIDDRDCDDSSEDVRPTADEVCNGVDDDCDSEMDEADDNPDLGSNAHCTACGDVCQLGCIDDVSGCDAPQALAAGANHTCAVAQSGAVFCWGANSTGELGVGLSPNSSSEPLRVGENLGLNLAISPRGSTCVERAGFVRCWGTNDQGQLGLGHSNVVRTPMDVYSGFSGLASLPALGRFHSCARSATGALVVECVGDNQRRQFGGTTPSSSLTWVSTGRSSTGFSRMLAGEDHTCLLTSSGALECWGSNVHGEMAQPTFGNLGRTTLSSPTNVSDVAAGDRHMCALSGSTVRCWGDNTRGQVGDGTSGAGSHGNTCSGSDCVRVPAEVMGLTAPTSVHAGGDSSCAVDGGALRCWGELGSTAPINDMAMAIAGATDVSLVALGAQHVCFVGGSPARIRCWGENGSGQLGDGTTDDRDAPVEVLPTP